MIPSFLDRSKIPHKPGVYIYKDSKESVLYVGKAIDLYQRVASYFSGLHPKGVIIRITTLVDKIASLDTIIVESELEALILEANLIKKYTPPFNVRLVDDKDYLYIGLTKEDFPKVITARKADLKTLKKNWGPFPSSRTVRDTLKLLRKVFPWCSGTNRRAGFLDNGVIAKIGFRACFYYHLSLCPGVCVGLISKEEYGKIIKNFSKFLDGKKEELVSDLTEQMLKASKVQEFEKANQIKKILSGINYITQTNRVASYLENSNFLEDENRKALEQLQKDLNLPKLPERIEGYDISNIQGMDAVGSMVVLTDGAIDKTQYRRFKMRLSGRPNDVGMHKEMIRRRLKHKEWPFPDLIIVDGGRGQARGMNNELRIMNYAIPIFGLAKRMEWLYPPEEEVIKLPKRSMSLKLLQILRDESHRFAITFYRKLHGRIILENK